MSDEEPVVCQICADFEPQAWRKSLCRNCFHTLEEHSEDLLAAEAETASKEKSDGSKPKAKDDAKASDSGSKDEKSKSAKSAAALDSKDKKFGASSPSSKNTPSSKSSSSSSSSSPSSTSSPSKTSLKSPSSTSSPSSKNSTSSSSTSSTSSTTTTTSSSSSSSSPSSSSKTTKTPLSSSPSSTSQVPPISKAKSLTSKFENTASKDKKAEADGPLSKTAAPKTLSKPDKSKPATDTNKSSKFGDTKSSRALDEKSPPKSDTLKSNKFEDSKKPSSKFGPTVKDTKDNSSPGKDDETKLKSTSKSSEDKDSKILPHLKSKNVAPFGKGMLRSTKDKEKDTVEKRADKTLASKEASTNEVKSKLASLGDKSSKFDSLDRKLKSGTDKSNESSTSSNTSVSGNVSSGKVGQSEKTGAQRVDEKLHSTQSATKNAREIDKPGTGKVNTEVERDARKLGWQVGGKEGAGTEAKKREEKARDEKDIKRVPLGKGQTSDDAVGKNETCLDSDKDRSLHKENKRDGINAKSGTDAKLDGIHRSGASATTSTSTSKTTAPTEIGKTSNNTSDTSSTNSTSTNKATTTTTTAAAATTSTSTSQALSKFLPSLQSRKGSKDGTENDMPKGKTSSKDGASNAASGSDAEAVEKYSKELKQKQEKVELLESQLAKMEKKLKTVEEEKAAVKNATVRSEKDDMEKSLQGLRTQLSEMQNKCVKLAGDNDDLMSKLQDQEKEVKGYQEVKGKTTENELLERDLEITERELDEVKDENSELQREIMEMKNEMDEMYDTFRENEQDEFRELQKELDMTAKNCRILQFKLRKAERRNEQIEEDRMHYEDKLRHLQDQFDSQDAKNHIRILEEELRIAKEVSVRLHDELDIIEDKKLKALEDNKHLTELLEHTDKRQFRMEMEIDKLRELVCDLRQELKEVKSGSGSNSSNRRDSSTPEKKKR